MAGAWNPLCKRGPATPHALAAKTLDGQSASKPFGAGCQPLLLGLKADEAAAAGRVHDAFRGLMNVAWMTILDRELLDLD